MGRPTLFDTVTAAEICGRIAAGESLRAICLPEDMPSPATVCRWHLEDREGFSKQYTRARQLQAQLLADELFSIADDGTNDFVEKEDKKGNVRVMPDMELVMRSRLRVDTRKWYLSKVLPKIYGDKITQEHTGELSIKRVVTDL